MSMMSCRNCFIAKRKGNDMASHEAGSKLTVIIRDDGPQIIFGDIPVYRRVTIELTKEQREKLRLLEIGRVDDKIIVEKISNCFIE